MKTTISLILFLIALSVYSQSTPEKFINALVNHNDKIKEFVDSDELARSERLGINYTGVKNKFLIGFDLDNFFKYDHADSTYYINADTLGDGYSFIQLMFLDQRLSPMYYFLNGKFVAPSKYFTRNWQTKESKYFIFKISEPKYFNDYCIKKLDEFVDKIADTLEFSSEEKALLEKEKIYYIFCKDEDEVQSLTGYKSKGQVILAFDEVVTAYPTHYHELAHLLINFKLKTLGLFTHPFFMEGFAVAMGGRGGMAPRVVTDIGHYLQKTGFLTYDSILTYDNFMSQDANMTYAVSGLYNTYLISSLGAKSYLDLYKKTNGDLEFVKKFNPASLKLPGVNTFGNFLKNYTDQKIIDFSRASDEQLSKLKNEKCGIFESGNYYKFYTKNKISWLSRKSVDINDNYQSRMFADRSKAKYSFQHYLIMVDTSTVSIYDCYYDELVFSYERSLAVVPGSVTFKNDFYVFSILKSVFDFDVINGGLFRTNDSIK